MDRRYFKLIEKAHDIAQLANALAMNAAYRDDVDRQTRPYLVFLEQELENARKAVSDAVYRQMNHDPQERDVDITPALRSVKP